jgi:hypothetical protein
MEGGLLLSRLFDEDKRGWGDGAGGILQILLSCLMSLLAKQTLFYHWILRAQEECFCGARLDGCGAGDDREAGGS